MNDLQQFFAFFKPGPRVAGVFHIADDSLAIDDHRSGPLDKNKHFLQSIEVIYVSLRIGQHRKWQVQALGITPRFLDGISQDEENFAILGFEALIKSA
jgi:hypothetical protein